MKIFVNSNAIAIETTVGTPQHDKIGVTFGSKAKSDIKSLEVHVHTELDANGSKIEVEGVEMIDGSGNEYCFPYQAITSINGINPTSNEHAYKLIETQLFGNYDVTT